MNKAIRRMARAAAAHDLGNRAGLSPEDQLAIMNDRYLPWERYARLMSIGLAALREPTTEMVRDGNEMLRVLPAPSEPIGNLAANAWRAMIDAALKE